MGGLNRLKFVRASFFSQTPVPKKGVLGIIKGQGSDRYRDGHGHGHGHDHDHDHGNGPWPHDHGHGLGFGQDQGQGEGQGQGPAVGQPKPCRGLAGAWPGPGQGPRPGLGPAGTRLGSAQWFIPVPSGLFRCPVVYQWFFPVVYSRAYRVWRTPAFFFKDINYFRKLILFKKPSARSPNTVGTRINHWKKPLINHWAPE